MSKLIKAPQNQLAVWGGALSRTTGDDGKWLGIPSGVLNNNMEFGTIQAAPVTSITISSTADDLCGVIWQPLRTVDIISCKIFYGQGGTTNTTHSLCLMAYDIDADGDLSNGVEVGAVITDSNSDDSSQLRSSSLSIVAADKRITSSQVLVAMIYCVDNINTAMTAKCCIEYKV